MAKLISVTCTRCAGAGHYSFNLTRGTVCFGCDGAGTVQTTQAKVAAAKRAKIKADAKLARNQENMAAKIAEHNALLAARIEKYKNDSRLGTTTRARCEEFPAVAQQTYQTLELVDSGKYLHSIADLAK